MVLGMGWVLGGKTVLATWAVPLLGESGPEASDPGVANILHLAGVLFANDNPYVFVHFHPQWILAMKSLRIFVEPFAKEVVLDS